MINRNPKQATEATEKLPVKQDRANMGEAPADDRLGEKKGVGDGRR